MKPDRRTLLKAAAALPVALVLPPATAEAGNRIVLHQGWVLRADDLERLGRR